MTLFQHVTQQFRRQPQHIGGIITLFLILTVGGCAHDGENSQMGEHSQGAYRHETTSPPINQEKQNPHHFSSSMEEELKLTAQQKKAFHRLQLDYDKMVVKKTADVRMAEVDLATLLGKDEPDHEAIQDQVKTIGRIKEDMMLARVDSLLALRGILSKAQYEQFRDILHQRMTDRMEPSPHEGL